MAREVQAALDASDSSEQTGHAERTSMSRSP